MSDLVQHEIVSPPHIDFGWQVNAVNWPLVSLSGLFMGLRVYLKLRQRRGLWWDDYILILSWLLLFVQTVMWSVLVSLGYGKYLWDIPADNNARIPLLLSIASTILILSNLLSKQSFSVTLLRLPIGWLKSFLWFIIVSTSLIIGLSSFTVWVQCVSKTQIVNPLSGLDCLPSQVLVTFSIFTYSYSAIMDITLAMLPWKFLWGLQMKTSEKIGVALAMSMGVFAAVTALIKTSIFPRFLQPNDITAGAQVITWGVVETAVSIMAASIPILRALVRQNGIVQLDDGMTESRPLGLASVQLTRPDVHEPARTISPSTDTGKSERSSVTSCDERASYEMTTFGTEARPVDFTV